MAARSHEVWRRWGSRNDVSNNRVEKYFRDTTQAELSYETMDAHTGEKNQMAVSEICQNRRYAVHGLGAFRRRDLQLSVSLMRLGTWRQSARQVNARQRPGQTLGASSSAGACHFKAL